MYKKLQLLISGAVCAAGLLFTSSCNKYDMDLVQEKHREYLNSLAVTIDGPFEVTVLRGSLNYCEVETNAYLLDRIRISQTPRILSARIEQGKIKNGSTFRLTISTDTLQSVTLSGGARMVVQQGYHTQDLFDLTLNSGSSVLFQKPMHAAVRATCYVTGGSQASLNELSAGEEIRLTVSDGSSLSIEKNGTIPDQAESNLKVTDGSRFEGLGFTVPAFNVTMSGGSQATVSVTQGLTAGLSGASSLKYRAPEHAAVETTELSGGSTIQQVP